MARKKKDALAIVFAAANQYQENLVDHSLLFLCMDKHKKTYCVEVTFDVSNFQHLTGLETDPDVISPAHFFQLCLDRGGEDRIFRFLRPQGEKNPAGWQEIFKQIFKQTPFQTGI